MISEITKAIIDKIKSEFDCKVYADRVIQGVLKGNFNVLCVDPKIERKNINNYDANIGYIITYFAKEDDDIYHECIEVYERLIFALENIGQAYCNNFTYNIDDNVMTIECDYKVRLLDSSYNNGEKVERMKFVHEVK